MRTVLQHEGGDFAPVRGEREGGPRRVAVLAGGDAFLVRRINRRRVEAVGGTQGQDRCSSRMSQGDTTRLRCPSRDRRESGRVVRFHAGDTGADAVGGEEEGERAEYRDQNVTRSCSDRGLRRRPGCRAKARSVRSRAKVDRVQGVMDRRVHHRVHAGFLRREATEEARRDRGLSGIGVPRGDRVRPRGRSRRRGAR